MDLDQFSQRFEGNPNVVTEEQQFTLRQRVVNTIRTWFRRCVLIFICLAILDGFFNAWKHSHLRQNGISEINTGQSLTGGLGTDRRSGSTGKLYSEDAVETLLRNREASDIRELGRFKGTTAIGRIANDYCFGCHDNAEATYRSLVATADSETWSGERRCKPNAGNRN